MSESLGVRTSVAAYVDVLPRILDIGQRVLQEIRAMHSTGEQGVASGADQQGDWSSILALLADRNRAFESLRQCLLPEGCTLNSPELLAAAAAEGWQELLEKVQALVQQVWAQNQEITAYLAPRRAEVSAALQRLQQMRNFNRTYRTTKLAFGPGLAVDQRG